MLSILANLLVKEFEDRFECHTLLVEFEFAAHLIDQLRHLLSHTLPVEGDFLLFDVHSLRIFAPNQVIDSCSAEHKM
jgi:hypothetical protein